MKFLYAEDNPADADLVRAHFAAAAADVQIEIAHDGAQCLLRLEGRHFDLLLLDNHLPDMDGLEVLRQVRAGGHVLPVVMVTGAGDDMTLWRALQAGADDYVPKRDRYLETLPDLLTGILRRHRNRSLLLRSADHRLEHRILYVEPNAMDAELTVAHFANAAPDLSLQVVNSGGPALALLESGAAYDLVLVDLRLPGMSTPELIRETQQRGIELPFVVITGRGDEATAVSLLRLGAYDYVVKRDNYLLQLPHSLRHALHRFSLDNTTRALQSELVTLNASLEQKVAQRTEQLQSEVQARLLAQEDLARSEGLLRMAGRMARLGAWMIELPARQLVWSAELCAILGVAPEDVPAVEDVIGFCARRWRARLHRRLDACIMRGIAFDDEFQAVGAGARRLWVRIMGRAVRDADGAIARVQGTLQDITERKQAEADWQELEARLRESQKLEAIGTFAGGIAHDFNNILGAILGNVALVKGEIETAHPVQASLEQIHRTASRGRDLVRKIRAFSRREPQEFAVQPLRPLIEESISMLRSILPAMVRMETCFSDVPVWVEVDGTQIQQVLMNLCVNAWHAMKGRPGCIQIGLDAEDAADEDDDGVLREPRARIWVRDDGAGIDPAARSRIFEPFFTTKSSQGTGLGLSVVHGIVLAHRGSISVDSAPGLGSTFHVYFPLKLHRQDDPVPGATDRPSHEPLRGEGCHVIYVDDDPVMTLMAERLLERLGYRVTAFQDPRAALEFVCAQPLAFDVAVCDFNMPALSGLDFARALAAIRRDLPVIISSGYFPDDSRAEAAELGVRGVLDKQNTADGLAPLIQQVLSEIPGGRPPSAARSSRVRATRP
jgi:PAS domain S-box-containing protein